MLHLIVGLTCCTWALLGADPDESERGTPPAASDARALTGPKLHAALVDPLLASFQNREIRSLLAGLSRNRRLSILLDRRIDPERKITLKIQNEPFDEALKRICELVEAEPKLVGNVNYIGPSASAAVIRSLVALRTQELSSAAESLSKERRDQLMKRETVQWNDLDRPRDVVEQLCLRHDVSIEELDRIPHDLWSGATLAEASLTEALSLILIQFNLSFVWKGAAEGIEIVPAPESVVVEKSYSVRGSASEMARRWMEKIPELNATVKGGKILV